jgi:hypothetical protein
LPPLPSSGCPCSEPVRSLDESPTVLDRFHRLSSIASSLIAGFALLAACQWALGAGLNFNGSDGDQSKVVFSYAFPPRLETYDLSTRQWTAPRALSSSPVVIAIDGNLAYVGTSERVIVVDLQTGTESLGPELTYIRAIDVIGNLYL